MPTYDKDMQTVIELIDKQECGGEGVMERLTTEDMLDMIELATHPVNPSHVRAIRNRHAELEARINGLVSDNATLQAWEFDWKQRAAKAEAKLAKLEVEVERLRAELDRIDELFPGGGPDRLTVIADAVKRVEELEALLSDMPNAHADPMRDFYNRVLVALYRESGGEEE